MDVPRLRELEAKWPKSVPQLTPEQRRISDDWQQEWHEKHLGKFTLIERFNHGYPLARCPDPAGLHTLEIGAGVGGHIATENLTGQEYYAVEFRADMANRIKERFTSVNVLVADCQQRLPLDDNSMDRVLAIHVLEHLPDLPAALREIRRLLRPNGEFVVVIPCEGGMLYSLARRISAQRLFERKYRMPYTWWIKSEHLNEPQEIIEELEPLFQIAHRAYFPFVVPSKHANICIGMTLRPRQ
jgi:ubiquinone/menaquinone biosynthesis C-methylase UbiE